MEIEDRIVILDAINGRLELQFHAQLNNLKVVSVIHLQCRQLYKDTQMRKKKSHAQLSTNPK